MKSGLLAYLENFWKRLSYSICSSAWNAPETVADDNKFHSKPSSWVDKFHHRVERPIKIRGGPR